MPHARNPCRDKAYSIYKDHNGHIDLTEIAKKLKIPSGTIRGWKNKDRWEEQLNGTFQPKIVERILERGTEHKESISIELPEEVKSLIEEDNLNENQQLFCLYYSKSFNAARSYQKAYGCNYTSAMVNGPRLLSKDKIKNKVMQLKQERYTKAFLNPDDIFQKFMDIAFSDITDYLDFGREEVPVMTMYGPLVLKDEETGEKTEIMKTINTVKFKESNEIDGSIISEVKQGKDGASLKLSDRMKALQWLTDHMNMATEEQQARIEALRSKSESDKPINADIVITMEGDLKEWGE